MNEGLLVVFFVYGLAFFGLGITLALETGRSPALAEARLLLPLAIFGVLHGIHEWLEFFVVQSDLVGIKVPPGIGWLRLAILAASFIALLGYGILAAHLPVKARLMWFLAACTTLVLYAAAISLSAILTYASRTEVPWPRLTDALVRYLLAVPGAILAGLGLQAQSVRAQVSRKPLSRYLRWAAFGFILYGVTQVFVPALDMVPANVISAESFLAATGVPHQTVRSVLAVIITIALMRATQAVDRERQSQLLDSQRARLEALQQRETLRRELLRHIVEAQEDERARIARELHDETAQILSGFSLELGALRNALRKNRTTETALDRLRDLSQQMSQGIYRMVHHLRPAQLDDLGLVPALQHILDQDFCPIGMQVEFVVEGRPRRLDSLIETVLFRVAQEGLANVARHAQTWQAGLRLCYEPNRVSIHILDHGCGFDPDERFHPPRGWGLAGMRERVEAIGGQMRIESRLGAGTRVEVSIGLNRETQEPNIHEEHRADAGG